MPLLARGVVWAILVLVVAILLVAAVGAFVLGAPTQDVRDLALLLAASGGGSLLAGLGATAAAPALGLHGLRARMLLAHLLALLVALVNVVVTAWLMFISPHDLALLGILLLFSTVVAMAFAGMLADHVLRAIHDLASAARQVASGRLGARVSVVGSDELATLERDFNEMAARLEASDRARREAEEARRQLYAAISHDLRTPLASIRAMVEAVNDRVVTDAATVERYLQTIHGEVGRLNGLIDDLFELSRLDAGALVLQIELGSLHDLLSDTLEAFQPRAAEKRLHLTGQVDPDVPPVLMDLPRIQRVLSNLVENAIRHTPSGGAIALDAEEEPTAVRVDVFDTGEGVSPEDLPHIFDPFYRGEKSRDRSQGGAGLGLAIARGLVEAHGGRIWAETLPGQGARFSFVLPKAGASSAGASLSVPGHCAGESGERATAPYPGAS